MAKNEQMFFRLLVMWRCPNPEAELLAKLYEETGDDFYWRTLAHVILEKLERAAERRP